MKDREWVSLGVIVTVPTMLLLLPGEILRSAGRWAWLSVLAGGAFASLPLWLIFRSPRLFENGLIKGTLITFGRVGMVLLLLEWLSMAADSVVIMRELSTLAEMTYMYQDVPLFLLTLLAASLATYTAALGFGTVTRLSVISLWTLLSSAMIIFILMAADAQWTRALPLAPQDFDFLHFSALSLVIPFFLEISTLAVWSDHLATAYHKPSLAPMWKCLAGATVIPAIGVLLVTVYWGPEWGARLYTPLLNAARDLGVGEFVRGLQAVLMPAWIIAATVKLAYFEITLVRLSRSIIPYGNASWHAVVHGAVFMAVSLVAFPNRVVLATALYWVGLFATPVMVLVALSAAFEFSPKRAREDAIKGTSS